MGVQAYLNVYSYFLNVFFAPSVVCSLCRSACTPGPGTLLSTPEAFPARCVGRFQSLSYVCATVSVIFCISASKVNAG